jgi:glyoxylase-like metal-dependent hydrolase (beta-lactamase superfamily II)
MRCPSPTGASGEPHPETSSVDQKGGVVAHVDRRRFFHLNAAVLAGAAVSPVSALNTMTRSGSPIQADDRTSPPGFYRFTLDEVEITVLNDGYFKLPAAVPGMDVSPHEFSALNVDPSTRETYFRSRLVPDDDMPLEASPVVIDSGGRRVLVDTGWSAVKAPPTTGHLGAALDASGITPQSIDLVVLTHCHPDHLGGLVDPAINAPSFPNAEVVLSDVELDLWTGARAEERLKDFPLPLPMIQDVLGAVKDRLRPIPPGAEVSPGITSLEAHGHTQGHMALIVETADHALLLPGDAIATIHAAFERPEWQNLFDHEPERAAKTRRRLLDRATTDEMLILGYHFPFPGLGRALRDAQAYRWYPAAWTVLT